MLHWKTWEQLELDRGGIIQTIVDTSRYDQPDKITLKEILEISANAYSRKRNQDDLWKTCEGKQVLNDVAQSTGFSGAPVMMQAVFAAWLRDGAEIPEELIAFREYMSRL